MKENKNKKNEEQLQDEQLSEVNGGLWDQTTCEMVELLNKTHTNPRY